MKPVVIPLFAFLEQVRSEPKKQSKDERIKHFARIYTQYAQSEAKNQTDRCIDCGNPYCQWKCPVHNYIPDWLKLVGEGKIMEAANLAHQTNTLPEVCGQVCPQESLCEGACTLNGSLGAVTIGAIENYLTETALDMGWKPDLSLVKKTNYRVAIIGAGPAGLACADKLARYGITAHVYDKHPEIGGLLTFGIPEFKLEKKIMLRRRKLFEEMGIQFYLNTEISADTQVEYLLQNYDALFLGMGADQGICARIPGEGLEGVYPALPFLIETIKYNMGFIKKQPFDLQGKRVLVLGAGDTAMDCSRSAVRMGAKSVYCAYRRDEKHRVGSHKDYQLAKEEGVEFIWWKQAVAFYGKKHIEFIEMATTEMDEQGQFHVTSQTEKVAIDAVIIAYGFEAASHSWFDTWNIETRKNRLVMATDTSLFPLQTSNEKIFAGGDLILGANLVVNAIAHGHLAAKSIVAWLG